MGCHAGLIPLAPEGVARRGMWCPGADRDPAQDTRQAGHHGPGQAAQLTGKRARFKQHGSPSDCKACACHGPTSASAVPCAAREQCEVESQMLGGKAPFDKNGKPVITLLICRIMAGGQRRPEPVIASLQAPTPRLLNHVSPRSRVQKPATARPGQIRASVA